MTSAEARFSNSLRPRKPEGSLGRTAQDGHLDSHTAPELPKRAKTMDVYEAHLLWKAIRCNSFQPLVHSQQNNKYEAGGREPGHA